MAQEQLLATGMFELSGFRLSAMLTMATTKATASAAMIRSTGVPDSCHLCGALITRDVYLHRKDRKRCQPMQNGIEADHGYAVT